MTRLLLGSIVTPGAVGAGPPRPPGPILAFLRCASCRFVAFYLAPFFAGLDLARRDLAFWVPFGVFYCGLVSISGELLNRLSDRVEDRVNRPERTALCEIVGYDRLRRIAIALWSVLTVTDIAWIAVDRRPALATSIALMYFVGINYSYLLRFKTRRYWAPIALTGTFWQPFLLGWSARPDAGPGASTVAAFTLLVCAVFVTIIGSKDVTDVAGDSTVGYHSFTLAMLLGNGAVKVAAIVAAPFALLAVFVAAGVLAPRFLLVLLGSPLIGAIVALLRSATTATEQQVARELFYHVWFAFLLIALLVFAPGAVMAAAFACIALYWLAASQVLHWNDGLRRWKLALARTLLARPARRTPAAGDDPATVTE